MRPADRGKQQRIRLRGNDAVKAWVDGHEIRQKSQATGDVLPLVEVKHSPPLWNRRSGRFTDVSCLGRIKSWSYGNGAADRAAFIEQKPERQEREKTERHGVLFHNPKKEPCVLAKQPLHVFLSSPLFWYGQINVG